MIDHKLSDQIDEISMSGVDLNAVQNQAVSATMIIDTRLQNSMRCNNT